MSLRTDLFDYQLPSHLIAQTPAARRDDSRLLVVDRPSHSWQHRRFAELPELLRPGDTLLRNNAAVLPARLRAQRAGGGQVECLLLRPTEAPQEWWCLLRPGRRLPVGASFHHGEEFSATVLSKEADGVARVRFQTAGEPIAAIAQRVGEMPLPPYIVRGDDPAEQRLDRERYQTIYADPTRSVAAAAPTAGLHFTSELLGRLAAAGVQTAELTLHVGLGTFRPIATATVEAHAIHRERYDLPVETQRRLFTPGAGRRIAVGTTTVRSVEDFLRNQAHPLDHPHSAEAAIYLYPPAEFRGVDALITNFHQPRSTLLCLVAAFLAPGSLDGIGWVRELYAEAIAHDYRFFSYGDAMLIL